MHEDFNGKDNRKLLGLDERSDDLQQISSILSDFVDSGNYRTVSMRILELIIKATGSEYGFIGATVPGGPQGITLRVFADVGFQWSPTTNRELFDKIIADYDNKGYIDFPSMDNLFGWPILNGKPIISNTPGADPRRSGRQPKGHPPTHSFLGLPIFKGDIVVGSIGLANKPGGYSEKDIEHLDNYTRTASVIFDSYRRLQHENRIIQDRNLAEENLRRAKEALLELAYSVSHELQEPLAALRGDLSLLAARYKDRLGSDADQFISNALSANAKINAMVDDLWLYARIDRPHLSFEPVDFNLLFDTTVLGFDAESKAKGASITRSFLPTISVQKNEIAILLQKIIDNAIRFSIEPKIHLNATQLVDEWLFTLSDNGVGFMQTEAQEIFKMFRKLNRETDGTGMGLPIARRIVEFHGGRIWAESEPNVGSKFFFTLPLVPTVK
jgi:signal transduction histidine kinase